ncbi:MAG: ethylbenzene dehydrogenase-related protein [Planctomycetota bacterium]|jgi:hypothetical protein
MTNKDDRSTTLPPTGGRYRGSYYPHLFRLLHWLLAPSLVVLALTGWSLHAASSPEWSLFGGVLPRFFWPGQVHFFHILAALVFAPSALAASWIYLRNRPRFQWTHAVLIFGSLALVVSGVLLMTWPGPAVVYLTARWVQFLVGLFVLPIGFLWHVLQGLTRRRRALVPAFHPWAQARWLHLLYFIPVVLLTTCLVLSGLPIQPPWRNLTAKLIPNTNVATAELDKLPWDDEDVEPVRIELAGGLGFAGGRTQVTLRALHNGQELFVLAEWDDPTEDRRDMPWRKTAAGNSAGWKRMVVNPDDETHYYEDKFSLVFPAESDWKFGLFGCALHCGQVDDKYWAEVDFDAKDIGRHGDPKTDKTGYEKNSSEDGTRPARLPRDAWASRHGIIPRESAVEYDSEEGAKILDAIPEGAVIPGIVASPAEGDRGDVRCMSRHRDGGWQLYIRRKLDTARKLKDGRPSDVRFVPGQSVPFGCAAFDHSSKRHAYNFSVYRLKLDERPLKDR